MILFRTGCIAAAFALVSIETQSCEADESFLFTCQTVNSERSLSLCGRQEDTGEGMRWLSLRFADENGTLESFSWPDDPSLGFKKFYFSHFFHKGLYEAYLRFNVGEDNYRIFHRDAAEGEEPESGVEISKPGLPVETVLCAAESIWYFDQTRFLTACDIENPLGAKACEHDPPELK